MEILELRAQAKRDLGSKFDIKKFHDAILDEGPLPLDVLKERVTAWIAEQGRGK
jgi:uncharacterized protein (DUF885 family)